MQEKALESDLPKVANRQVGLMMNQLAAAVNWEIDYKQLETNNKKELSEFSEFRGIE
jgi:hypothetical protein